MNNIIDCTQVTLYKDRIPKEFYTDLSEQLLKQSQTQSTLPRSNPDCWQGRCEFTPEQDRMITNLVTDCSNEYIKSLPVPEDLDRVSLPPPKHWKFMAWANVNKPGSNNVIHMHDTSMITLVLYLQGTGTGRIRFHPLHYLNKVYKDYWPYNGDWFIEPNDGDVIVFPSYLLHTVETNEHKTRDRICIAVNADLV